MLLMYLSSFVAFTLVCAAPSSLKTSPSFLEIRQEGSFSTTWNDDAYPEPLNFEVYNAGAPCTFQIAYERFRFDRAYIADHVAEYADGSSTLLRATYGSFATDALASKDFFGIQDSYPEDRAPYVVFFPDACQNGLAPQSFRVNFALPESYPYENNWTTGSLPILSDSLADEVTGVKLVSGNTSTVTWEPVDGATNYVILAERLSDSEVGPRPIVIAYEVFAARARIYSTTGDVLRAAVLANRGGDNGRLSGGAKQFTALNRVFEVGPSARECGDV